MKKIILILLSVLAAGVVSALGWYFYNANKYTPETYMVTPESNQPITSTSTVSKDNSGNTVVTPGATTFTNAEISSHNSASSCYSIINGVVYDLTMWVNLHPGGKGAILSVCGIDGTEKFMKKHKGGAKFMDILKRYKIGVLAQ